jgi:hypothetical protein
MARGPHPSGPRDPFSPTSQRRRQVARPRAQSLAPRVAAPRHPCARTLRRRADRSRPSEPPGSRPSQKIVTVSLSLPRFLPIKPTSLMASKLPWPAVSSPPPPATSPLSRSINRPSELSFSLPKLPVLSLSLLRRALRRRPPEPRRRAIRTLLAGVRRATPPEPRSTSRSPVPLPCSADPPFGLPPMRMSKSPKVEESHFCVLPP